MAKRLYNPPKLPLDEEGRRAWRASTREISSAVLGNARNNAWVQGHSHITDVHIEEAHRQLVRGNRTRPRRYEFGGEIAKIVLGVLAGYFLSELSRESGFRALQLGGTVLAMMVCLFFIWVSAVKSGLS